MHIDPLTSIIDHIGYSTGWEVSDSLCVGDPVTNLAVMPVKLGNTGGTNAGSPTLKTYVKISSGNNEGRYSVVEKGTVSDVYDGSSTIQQCSA